MKELLIAAAIFCAAFSLFAVESARISFEDPKINSQNQILVSVNHRVAGNYSGAGNAEYKTLFFSDAEKPDQVRLPLTCFPEKMELLCEGKVVQIRNRFGTARYSVEENSLAWLSLADFLPVSAIKLAPQCVSPDGKWVCFVRKRNASLGTLVIKNASSLEETVLDGDAEFSYESVPVKWAPDGSYLLYQKAGAVYFCDPNAVFQKIDLDESLRKIGSGSISSVSWSNSKSAVYIQHDLVYRINVNELYTRSIYSKIVGIGTVVGRLPFVFDKNDNFWADETGKKIAVVKDNCIVSCFELDSEGSSYITTTFSKPFSDNRGSVIDCQVLWANGVPVLWVNYAGFDNGRRKSVIYTIGSDFAQRCFVNDSGLPLLSPDGRKIAYTSGSDFCVVDTHTWKELCKLSGETVYSYIWSGNSLLYVGGERFVWQLSLPQYGESARLKKLLLSTVKTGFWNGSVPCAIDDSGAFYEYKENTGVWKKVDDSVLSSVFAAKKGSSATQNGIYRIFTGATESDHFENSLMVRAMRAPGSSRAVFRESTAKAAPRRKVSLAFDALDNADGLSRILSVLDSYGIKATFFLNGEFIRRYPKETNQITSAGHICGSMFYTVTDLTMKGFVLDETFVRRGLGRNEDEFLNATGKELALLWHAPFYKSNAEIVKSGENAGYKYVEAERFCLDTATLENAVMAKQWYLGADDIVSFYVENATDGSVIPISVGKPEGLRTDYLYEKLDLLIGALLDAGFDIVPLL